VSEKHETHAQMTAAKNIRAQAAEWLERRDDPVYAHTDDAQLQAWLAESPAHEIAYWRLEAAWRHADRLSALRRSGFKTVIAAGRSLSPMLAKTAAVLIVLAVVGAGAATFFLHDTREQSFSTSVGGHESITLADGSQVELNTNTTLRVVDGAQTRQVWLDSGEAYFQIKHDRARPFVVLVGDHRITDIGTKFAVRRDTDHVEISLVEGRARLESASVWAKSQSAILSPGDLAIAGAHDLSVTKKPLHVFSHELAWRTGQLVFDHVTLAGAAAELNRYNRQQIVIADAPASLLTIDGTFPVNGVGKFTHAAEEVFGLRVEQLGDKTVISR